jgi:hypothetical protein
MKRLVIAAVIAVAAVVPSVVLAREEPAPASLAAPSPRPTPAVVGIQVATPAPRGEVPTDVTGEVPTDVTGEVLDVVSGPSVTLPPTDTE